MRELLAALAVTAFLVSPVARAADNPALATMYQEDQRDRREGQEEARCLLNAVCDKERQVAALEIVRAGHLRTANDYFHAAMIFQHSILADDNALAYALASVAARIDPEHRGAKWLAAAAWDRTLMRKSKPQWYGTQFTKPNASAEWELYPVDETVVTDEERKKLGVPTLAEARERVRKMNGE